jgi:uncharacterized Ntn-hydrolase superfamily protein
MTNRYLGPAVLDGMARGLAPELAISSALAGDEGRGLRQIHAVDQQGRTAAWTGENCVMWCGSMGAHGVSVAGNMLAGEAVVSDTLAAMEGEGELPERLMRAMAAGESAGGDRRGKQSAAMLLVTTEDFPDLNLRVDDHPDPLGELDRLLGLWRRDVAPMLPTRPNRANPPGLTDLDQIEAGWIARGLDIRLRRP